MIGQSTPCELLMLLMMTKAAYQLLQSASNPAAALRSLSRTLLSWLPGIK